jgi:hypothetical protein
MCAVAPVNSRTNHYDSDGPMALIISLEMYFIVLQPSGVTDRHPAATKLIYPVSAYIV